MTEYLVAIGTRKGLFLGRSPDRESWDVERADLGMNSVSAVCIDTRRGRPRLLAGATSGHWGPSVLYSDDLGKTWQEPDRAPISFPEGSGAALAQVWQLQPSRPAEPDVVWAGTEPSALFRSEDGGMTYELVHGLWEHPHRPTWQPGGGGQCLHTVVPHPSDASRATVAMSTGGVYQTTDGGQSWAPSNAGIVALHNPDPYPEYGQCVHKISTHADEPDRMFLQNHGGVFRSDDGGGSWSPIGGDLPADFGFPIVAHPRRPGSVFVFPLLGDFDRTPPESRCRVFRTDNAGETWRPLEKGLPQDGFQAAVMRDAMSADNGDPTGLYLGTRSGAVFASGDEGDSWHTVALHLPDVLSIRAAVVG
jgi:photosystem II stability/assembly factor-like uncharacterized protein